MKSVLFTKSKNDSIHKFHRNFIEEPPEGYKYIDINGDQFNSIECDSEEETQTKENSKRITNILKDKLYTFTKRSGILIYLQKFRSGMKYVKKIDKSNPDIVYGLNGQYYFGEKPWIVDFEDPMVFAGHNSSALKYRSLMKKSFLKDNCKAIVAYSETDKKAFLEMFGKNLEKKVHVSHNVINQPENIEKIQHEGFNVLFTGSSNLGDDFYFRGGRETLRAFKKFNEKHPNSQLIIRSKIPEEERFLVQDDNIKVIEETIPRGKFQKLFRKSDIYLHPSYKGCALSIPEAMSYGLPIVGSDIVENDEYIEDGENGLKAEAKHVEFIHSGVPTYYGGGKLPSLEEDYIDRIAEKIEILYQNPDLRYSIRKNNIQKAEDQFSIKNKNRKLREIFENAL